MNTRVVMTILIAAAVSVAAVGLLMLHVGTLDEPAPTTLPTPVSYQELPSVSPIATQVPTPRAVSQADLLPAEVNLDIPFTPQAPHGIWDLPYKEFCEEASVLMVASYVGKDSFSGPDEASARMNLIFDWAKQNIGPQVDTTAVETARMLQEYYGISDVEVVPNPEVEQLQRALADGRAVIIPATGQQLGNPYFTPPGPPYHMLVLKGYTADGKFITNDPGTRHGKDFLYDFSTIMRAIHDFNDGDVDNGRKVVIIVG